MEWRFPLCGGEAFRLPALLLDLRIDAGPVLVVIGKSRVNLSQGKAWVLKMRLFRAPTIGELVEDDFDDLHVGVREPSDALRVDFDMRRDGNHGASIIAAKGAFPVHLKTVAGEPQQNRQIDRQLETRLERWLAAELIDPETAERIRDYETGRPDTRRLRWPVIVALALGGVLLATGIFLFVAAHWESLSPSARMATVVAALAVLHGFGAWSAPRFPALATTMHAIGTTGLGGAIALAGQIYNMEEHWPAMVLLWAVGAWCGVWLLRDIPQLAIAAVLTPGWVASELADWSDSAVWTAAFVALTSLLYLAASRREEKTTWRNLLSILGAVTLLPAAIVAAVAGGNQNYAAAWFLLLPVPFAFLLRRRDGWPVAAWAAWAFAQAALSLADRTLLAHACAAAAAVGLVAWGIADLRRDRVNLGVAGFALTVLFFYFSKVMDSIDRSLSLILLGVLFLAGGWQLERLRRRLMLRIAGGAAL